MQNTDCTNIECKIFYSYFIIRAISKKPFKSNWCIGCSKDISICNALCNVCHINLVYFNIGETFPYKNWHAITSSPYRAQQNLFLLKPWCNANIQNHNLFIYAISTFQMYIFYIKIYSLFRESLHSRMGYKSFRYNMKKITGFILII